MTSPKIHIIILNWNGADDTIECLDSLKRIDYPNYEVILVDNHSDGDDVIRIQKAHGDYLSKIIVTENNLGFSGGNNKGIEYALSNMADYILLLNNDTIVETDFLSELVKINENSEIGIFTPLINYYAKPRIVWCAGGYISKLRASGFPYGIDQNEDLFRSDRICSFASGCCMLIKREVFEKIGTLDERYFLYLEDTDYCARTLAAGFKIKFVASSKIYHKVFSSTGRINSQLPIYYSVRNRLYFANKNLGWFYYPAMLYIFSAFVAKSLTKSSLGIAGIKLIIGSFKDYFSNMMGKSNRV